jgi:hypothetical protein
MHAKRLYRSYLERLVLHDEALTDCIIVCISYVSWIEGLDPTPYWRDDIGADLPKKMFS